MQVTSSTSSTGSSSASTASTAATSSKSSLSETQFLQLLTEQLQNQDPLQPMDDTQFLAQMAQFTSLQETDTMNQQLERLTAASYIGSTVTLNPGTSSAVTGQVTGVDTSGSDPQVYVNGAEYPISDLKLIGLTTAPSTTTSSTSASAPAASSASSSNAVTNAAASVSNTASAVGQAASNVSSTVQSITSLLSPKS